MISKTIGFRGLAYFQTHPYREHWYMIKYVNLTIFAHMADRMIIIDQPKIAGTCGPFGDDSPYIHHHTRDVTWREVIMIHPDHIHSYSPWYTQYISHYYPIRKPFFGPTHSFSWRNPMKSPYVWWQHPHGPHVVTTSASRLMKPWPKDSRALSLGRSTGRSVIYLGWHFPVKEVAGFFWDT